MFTILLSLLLIIRLKLKNTPSHVDAETRVAVLAISNTEVVDLRQNLNTVGDLPAPPPHQLLEGRRRRMPARNLGGKNTEITIN